MQTDNWMLGLTRAEVEVVKVCVCNCNNNNEIICAGNTCPNFEQSEKVFKRLRERNE